MKVDLSCPIELWEYELPTVENPICSFTFFNLGDRIISSIQITVTFFDDRDEVISRRVERPMALEAVGREPFVVDLPSEGLPVETIDLTIDKVWFEDGTEWRRQQDIRLVDYEPNELPPNRKLEQLRFVAGRDAVGFPSEQGNIWICICGRVNASEEATCRRCDRSKREVFERFSPGAVKSIIDERERELEEKARLAREEASRQEFMRQDKIRRKKRARRTRTAIISAAVVLLVLSYLFVVLGLPELKYQSALSAMGAGELESARQSFVDLADYRDASDMVDECDLRLARAYATSGEPAKIDTAIEMLDGLGSYPGAADLAQEARYEKAEIFFAEKNYEQASAAFEAMGDYRDAQERHLESDYLIATGLLDAGEYDQAAPRFAALGKYKDAAALARECVYRPAMQKMADGEYADAAELFAQVSGYRDSNEQRLQAIYQDALRAQLAGDPEYAAERFTLLGDYEDSPEQVKHSIYLAANSARDAGNYEMAIKLYATIPEYQDAAEQVKACTYLPAKEMLSEGRYEEAAQGFKQVPGYLDADDLYIQSIYLPATEAIEREEYELALRLMRQIPEYRDVAKLTQQAEYGRAGQLEQEGHYEAAAEMYEALGSHSDAQDKARAARYQWAEEAFVAGQYQVAADRFEPLGRYSDAQTRVKECRYELAMLLYDAEDFAGAYEAFSDIDDYDPATEMQKRSAYDWGDQLAAGGDLMAAADAFALAGRFEDAQERRQQSIYRQAEAYELEEEYQEAGELFNSIAEYTDAKARRDAAYDMWLAAIDEEAERLSLIGDYQVLIDYLKAVDLDALPKAYAHLKTMYQDANLRIARQLINEDRALDAYAYLMAARGYRNADDLLDKNIYRILGTWETEDGTRFAFYLNGTAFIGGETMYFNMFNPYGISLGETSDPDDMKRMYNYSSGSENTLSLREESSGKTIKMTRVRAPEISRTNDSAGAPVMDDAESAPDPVVDTITVGGDVEEETADAGETADGGEG